MGGSILHTSDQHFGHLLAARKRGYVRDDETDRDIIGAGIADHDADIIRYHNQVARKDDIVWFHGDITAREMTDGIWALVDQLNGEKHLILGNHDAPFQGHRHAYKHQREWLEHFETISAYGRRYLNGEPVLLTHLPYLGGGDHSAVERYAQYRFPDRGMWNLCGHVHELWKQKNKMINVGVDAWAMAPAREHEIVRLMRAGAGYLPCPPTPRQAVNGITEVSECL